MAWFGNMIENCYAHAEKAKAAGRPVVGLMCEYTPRELIIAAGGVPVLLCGGSAEMVEPAERDLPANLCPLIKSTYGYHLQEANPFLEMADLVVGETTCDGKKKMFELMAESRPMYVLELPHKQGDPDAQEHWYREVSRFRSELEERLDSQITDDGIRRAIRALNRERRLRRGLARLMKATCPPLTGRQLLALKSSISGIPADLTQYREALRVLRERRGDPAMARRVRVLLTGVPLPHGAERVMELIEDRGGLVVCQENCTGLRPLLREPDPTEPDPLRALADTYFHLPCSVMTRNDERIASLIGLAREYRAQCIIELVWQACLTYDVESYFVRRAAERDLHISYLRIQTDYSPSDSARIEGRIEALFEMVRKP